MAMHYRRKIKQDEEAKQPVNKAASTPEQHDSGALQRAAMSPGDLSPDDVLELQDSMGNRAVNRLLSQSVSPATLQPKREDTAAKPEPAALSEKGFQASGAFEQRLAQSRSGGKTLSPEVRRQFEPKFKQDFSQVKIHTDGESASLNRQIGAKAFTHGQDIYMGKGQYQPHAGAGRELLAHELTHTVQQNNGVQRQPMIQRRNEKEREAARNQLQEALTPTKYERLKSNFFVDNATLVEEILLKKRAINAINNEEFKTYNRNADLVNKIHSLSGPSLMDKTFAWFGWGGGEMKGEGDGMIKPVSKDPTKPESRPLSQEHEFEAQGDWTAEDEKQEEEPFFDVKKVEINLIDENDFKFEKGTENGLLKAKGKGGVKGSFDPQALKSGDFSGVGLEGVGEIGFQLGKDGKKEGALDWTWGGTGLVGRGALEGFVGAKSEAKGKGQLGVPKKEEGKPPDPKQGKFQAGLKGKAGAFLGANVETSTKIELMVSGQSVASTAGKLGLAFGLGGEYAGKIEFKGGKLAIGGKGKIAAGLGFSFGYELKMDTVGIFTNVIRWLSSWIW